MKAAKGAKTAKKSRHIEDFDVTDFLRPDDRDLRTALASLMGVSPAQPSPVPQEVSLKSRPGPNLDPGTVLGPGPKTVPDAKLAGGLNLDPGANLVPPPNSVPPVSLEPPPNLIPEPSIVPGINLRPDPNSLSGLNIRPGLKLRPAAESPTPGLRQYPIRHALSAEEGHSRGEQAVYDALWRDADPQPDGSRLLRIGMLGLARRAGMSESNIRVNLRGLVQKLSVEEETGYVCEAGQGRTWRVLSPDQILQRRRTVGMEWYRKRTLAVVFVNPEDQ